MLSNAARGRGGGKMAAPPITAEAGQHPAARQLAAYNAPPSAAKLPAFLKCFDADAVELRDLATGERKLSAAEIATRYATVFEHSTALRAQVTKRLLVSTPRGAPGTMGGGLSFAVDFEQYSGLIGPTGSALDGSTGLAPAAAADIVAVYRVIGAPPEQVPPPCS
eukprot:COSAG03_NODE_4117_length_1678_cov_17.122863_2_plen_165_part_00